MSNRIVWFDVPALDLARAINFYSRVLDAEIKEEFPGVAVFSHNQGEISGCVFKTEDVQPTDQGALLYYNVSGRLDDAVSAVEECGGTIKEPPHPIGEFGHRALVIDSEGNRIALHSE